MSNVKLEITGLKEFKEAYSKATSLETFMPNITSSIQLLHNTMEQSIKENYYTPGSLTDVLVGRSVKPVKQGKTFLRYQLQYKVKSISLIDYPNSTVEKDVTNAIPYMQGGSLQHQPINKARKTTVKVKKRGGLVSFKNKSSFGKFKVTSKGMRGIYVREQEATWDTYPTGVQKINGKWTNVGGKRASYRKLFGPSLAKLAETVYVHDAKVAKAKDRVTTDIINAMASYYRS
jgi:hypothetical protein